MIKALELLAPAKDLECGMAAIDHGADAVYIGPERFGARTAAGNSIDDIRQLCNYAHRFLAKVYATVNTIVYDNEIDDITALLKQLKTAGVDAVLIQDMALISILREIGMPYHASTQTDNRTAQKVKWLQEQGFSRVVLARELSINEIEDIHHMVEDMPLEVFVHGALCVSYSGLCYASQHCFNRSANRGACAQFCRMPFDLIDSNGKVIEQGRHLLSLKDMCQIDNLERLAMAGAISFKIEGRLKDISYVKNITSAYSSKLNEIIIRHPDLFQRASIGWGQPLFEPNINKTFNRGYTTYFANGRQRDIASFDTPKAMGEYVGTVKEIRGKSFNVAGVAAFANGDGLCFLNERRQLEGFRVNRVEGNRLFPLSMPHGLRKGVALYRNNDQEFDKMLSRSHDIRKIDIILAMDEAENGFLLTASVANRDINTTAFICQPHEKAKLPQTDNIIKQLSKLGNTIYRCKHVNIARDFDFFIPSSRLTELKRMIIENLNAAIADRYAAIADRYTGCSKRAGECCHNELKLSAPPTYGHYTYLYNIANQKSRDFYMARQTNKDHLSDAYELKSQTDVPLMQCRHCIRFALGHCTKHGGTPAKWHEPLWLVMTDGRRFRLYFNCAKCQMEIIAHNESK